jgi:uncharacterized iron-regulated membrane protein
MFSRIKKTIRFIHLWLGLLSGLVVFIIATTGAIWSFESEISNFLYPYRNVEIEDKPVISIAKIKKIVAPHLQNTSAIYYNGKDKSIEVREWNKVDGETINNYLNLNPYSGEILKIRKNESTFFDYVLDLHINLMLGEFGHTIVKYATFIFLFLLISGIYLWWPKKKKGIKQRITLDWKKTTKWKRKNYDLHSVLGFYASLIIIFAVLTGLAWSFKWVDKTIYSVATLGEKYKDYTENSSSKKDASAIQDIDDVILNRAKKEFGKPYESWNYYFAKENNESISVYINPDIDTFYKSSSYFFDQRTAQLLLSESSKTKNNGQNIRDMYFDIHIGKILGLPGQLLMFFSSILVASLPITGFLIWLGRRNKKNNKTIKN